MPLVPLPAVIYATFWGQGESEKLIWSLVFNEAMGRLCAGTFPHCEQDPVVEVTLPQVRGEKDSAQIKDPSPHRPSSNGEGSGQRRSERENEKKLEPHQIMGKKAATGGGGVMWFPSTGGVTEEELGRCHRRGYEEHRRGRNHQVQIMVDHIQSCRRKSSNVQQFLILEPTPPL